MLYSMTGFGKGVAEIPGKKITVEVKSLNSKQADIATRIPSSLRGIELEMRNRIVTALLRGKIDVTVTVETIAGEAQQSLNIPALKQYVARIMEMRDTLGLPEPTDWYSLLLRFPDSMKAEAPQEADDSETEAALAALDSALKALMDYRRVEGEKLESFFALRIERIARFLAEVPRYETERIERIRLKMEEGLSTLNGVDFDRSRLEQELFFFIEKLDINEEKQRLAQHLEYFMQTMASSDTAQGKKLGFISQEMGREINTLGSKSNHSEMQRLVVRMKDELEQIKEQVLNVL
ncbi:MAG: YicC family protein [Muribaculaceae bacterium]|nr:YicC family protein [Muribaculaceae bacterium]